MTAMTKNNHMLTCPVCGESQWRSLYDLTPWTIEECTKCRFARIDPLPERAERPDMYSEERIVSRQNKKRGPISQAALVSKRWLNKHFRHNKNKIFLDKLHAYLPNGGRLLDGGCGAGGILLHARDRYECHGIEISAYLAELANRNEGLNVQVGDLQTYDFKGLTFDAITLVSIIEHLDDPAGMVRKCHDLLKPGGVLLLKTPNFMCMNRFIRRSGWPGLRPPDHLVYFSPRNLQLLLEKAGFRRFSTTALPFNDNMYIDAFK